MHNPFFSFTIKTILILSLTFGIHLGILYALRLPLFENKIVLSYTINTLLVIGVFGLLYFLRNKFKSQLGFLFMAGSLLKFTVFFIVFNPYYKLDGDITKLEFLAFFTPYVIGLILETLSLNKLLNKLDS